ncbi:MAG: hypothetical protein J6R79_02655 [Bacteroidaceae bacterium]|nr:hypothetical protein [Bacteroidaceae bacterium]
MLVVHPQDITTGVLTSLYEGTDSKVVDQTTSKREIEHMLHHCPPSERIMLLGHGSQNGLFSRTDDKVPEFDRIIVGHPHAYHLRRHGANIIGIWCHADKFARKEGLHGLFTGMIISDKWEAEEYGIITLQHHIEEWNERMFAKLRNLLDENVPLHEIPERMRALNDERRSSIESFNYENFFYL